MKLSFIHAEKALFPLAARCRIFGVCSAESRSSQVNHRSNESCARSVAALDSPLASSSRHARTHGTQSKRTISIATSPQQNRLRSEYRDELAALGTRVSMSRKGNCWNNAVAESFFSSLNSELLHRHLFGNCASLRSAVFEYIEVFSNRRRLHSSLNDKTPAEVERAFALANAA